MDFPVTPILPRHLGTICTSSLGSAGGNGHQISGGGLGSAVWPAANRAMYVPFRASSPLLVRRLFVYNGATVSGNIDVGIYDEKGTRLVSAGSTAQAGTSVLQLFDITDYWLGVGLFYFGLALDNGTGTVIRGTVSNPYNASHGILQQATAFPLPAVATFAAASGASFPHVGLTTRTVI